MERRRYTIGYFHMTAKISKVRVEHRSVAKDSLELAAIAMTMGGILTRTLERPPPHSVNDNIYTDSLESVRDLADLRSTSQLTKTTIATI